MRTHKPVPNKLQLLASCLLFILPALAWTAVKYTSLPPYTPLTQALEIRLEKLEALLAQASDYQRYILLDTTARTAMELKQYDKAEQFARDLHELAPAYPQDWNYASALHHSRIILGRTALLKGDIATAKRYLLAAGQAPGSDILDNSGPDLQLASDLLKRNERTAVINYLKACRTFWSKGRGRLDQWLNQLGKGETPNLLARSSPASK